MSDLISRADAIRVISEEYHNRGGNFDGLDAIRELETLPSKGGDAEILNEDFRPKYMQQCPNNGADLISRADAIEAACNEMDWLDDGCVEERKTLIKDALSALPSADAEESYLNAFYDGFNTATLALQADAENPCKTCGYYNLECPEDCEYSRPSAEAIHIHNDGTLEVKVPNAQKVGRVLIMDTDSHIGGGLFYPDREDGE